MQRHRLRGCEPGGMAGHAIASLMMCFALLAGCTTAPSHEHELRIALPIDPTSLSPLIAFDQNQIATDLLWCQTLVGLDERNHFIPVLVTRIPSRENGDVSADGLRITYRLRRDVRFADGVPLTSADVAFTYKAIFEPANAAAIDAYARIAGLTTPDAHTVVVRLRKPWSAAVHVLFAQADFAYGILPKHAFVSPKTIGSAWDQKPFGTGPFRVKAWQRGESIELEPNPYFVPKPKLTRLVLRIIPNITSAFNALQTHELDIAELDSNALEEAAKISSLRIVRIPENGLRAVYFQTTTPPTNDVHVRRAIAYALDTYDLSKAWRGIYPRARSLFPAPLISWAAAQPPAYPHDLASAGRELDRAGWRLQGKARLKGGRPLILIGALDATSAVSASIALVVQEQLAPLGVGVTLKPYASNVFSAPAGPLRTGRFTFTPSRLFGGSDPEQSINLLCATSRDGGDNYSRYCSEPLERYFADQLAARNEAQRQRDFDAIARLVAADVPLIPLYDSLYIQGVDTRVSGYARNMLRYPVNAENWDARSVAERR